MTRREAREVLMQAIFQMEAQKDNTREALQRFLDLNDVKTTPKQKAYIDETFQLVSDNLDQINNLITNNSNKWSISRIPKVDLAILRLGVCEAFFVKDVPPSVAINEAVELSKKYGSQESSKFINGVLGRIVDELL